MWRVVLIFLLIAVSLFTNLACKQEEEGNEMSSKEIAAFFKSHGLPAYPKLKELADQVIYTPKVRRGEIGWHGFYSSDPLEKIILYYQERVDKKSMEAREEGAVWRMPAEDPKIVLTVMSVSAPGPHHQYLNLIPKDAKSLIILSKMISSPKMTEEEVLDIALPEMEKSFPHDFSEYKPYKAMFKDGIWTVEGTLQPDSLGGTPAAKVRDSDGKILEVYHTQ